MAALSVCTTDEAQYESSNEESDKNTSSDGDSDQELPPGDLPASSTLLEELLNGFVLWWIQLQGLEGGLEGDLVPEAEVEAVKERGVVGGLVGEVVVMAPCPKRRIRTQTLVWLVRGAEG